MEHNTDIDREHSQAEGACMFGAVRRYQRNQRLYGILNDHRNYSDPTPIENKRLIVSIDGRSMDTELRPNELCFLN